MDTCIYIPVKVGNFVSKISSHIKFNFYGLSFTTWWGIAYKPYIRNAFNSVRWTAMLGAIETSLHVPSHSCGYGRVVRSLLHLLPQDLRLKRSSCRRRMQCTLTGLIFFEKMAHRQYRSAAESVAGNRRTQCASEGKLPSFSRVVSASLLVRTPRRQLLKSLLNAM